jgi:uncharacterized membrane protein
MQVFVALAVVLGIAAMAQAIRIGVVRHDWIAIKLFVGLTLASGLFLLVAANLNAGE